MVSFRIGDMSGLAGSDQRTKTIHGCTTDAATNQLWNEPFTWHSCIMTSDENLSATQMARVRDEPIDDTFTST
jgi:hypothetical protein